MYVWGYLFIALCGYYLLAKQIFSEIAIKNRIFALLFPLIFFSSLVPLWVFSTHELMFMSLFTAFPYIYYLLTSWSILSKKRKFILVTFFIPLFFSSSVNVIVFAIGYLLLFLLAVVNKDLTLEAGKRFAWLGILFLLLTQIMIFTTRGPVTITAELSSHLLALSNSPEMKLITDDLQKAEKQNGALTNSMRFATGWLALFDEKENYVFPWAVVYRNNYVVIISQITGILFALVFALRSGFKKSKLFGTIFILASVIMSTVGLSILMQIPYLSAALRSTATKLWPMLFIPYIVIVGSLFVYLAKKSRFLLIGYAALLLISAFPWITGTVYNNTNAPKVPIEYTDFYAKLQGTDTVLILPDPQTLYFRTYTWGYYGSDLVSYMTTAKILDGTSISKIHDEYTDLLKSPSLCTKLMGNVTFIAVEKDIATNPVALDSSCLSLIKDNKNFQVYQVNK